MKTSIACFACLTILSAAATAQGYAETTVETIGRATTEPPADYVEFTLRSSVQAETNVESAKKLAGFEKQLREAVDKSPLSPSSVQVNGPAPGNATDFRSHVSATVKLEASTFRHPTDEAEKVAGLCDEMTKIAKALSCSVEGPNYGVNEPARYVQESVAKAVENAYYPAEAAAVTLQAEIVSVARVEVDDVAWETNAGTNAEFKPSSQKIRCTATVRVTYAVLGQSR